MSRCRAGSQQDGYHVETAEDGPSALERMKKERWSVLLVDMKMPGMDGLQVLEQARQMQPDLVAVIMTAYATVDTAVSAMKLGAYDYLVKPFDPDELSLMMQKIVAQQALVRENALLRKALRRDYRFRDLVSKSPAMQQLFDLARTGGEAARRRSSILGRERDGQGTDRPGHPRREPAGRRPVRRRVVRGADRDAARVRAVRPRARRVHRRRRPPQGQVRGGPPRHASSWTRSATSAPSCSSTCCACSRSGKFTRIGGVESVRGGRARDRRHQPRPAEGGGQRRVPRGPLLPAERDLAVAPAAARAQGGHPAAGRPPARAARGRGASTHRRRVARGDDRADGARLARQRAGAAQRARTRGGGRQRARWSSPADLGLQPGRRGRRPGRSTPATPRSRRSSGGTSPRCSSARSSTSRRRRASSTSTG